MILDNNLIAFEYDKTQFVPKKVYESGAKDDTAQNSSYFIEKKEEKAILILENDIINSDGYGLKKGFYNVIPDKYQDFLLIYESGNLKAKVPIIETKILENVNSEQFKPKKMSYRKYQKQQQKEYRKYLNGTNPNEIDYKSAQIHYLDEPNSCLLIYNTSYIELIGIIKF